MNQQEACKLWEQKKPCFYVGEQHHLRNIPLYIKDVTDISARVNSSPDPRDYENVRTCRLINLITEDELNRRKAIAVRAVPKAIANRN